MIFKVGTAALGCPGERSSQGLVSPSVHSQERRGASHRRTAGGGCPYASLFFCFTRTTVIFENPSSNAGGFNLAAILRMTSSGTARPRR
jgi:hypothetical protein